MPHTGLVPGHMKPKKFCFLHSDNTVPPVYTSTITINNEYNNGTWTVIKVCAVQQ